MAKWIEDLYINDRISSNSFGDFEVLYINGSRDVGVRFLETGTVVRGLQKGNVKRGCVSDYMVPTVEGVGYVGAGGKGGSKSKAYSYWHSMLERCYSEVYHKTRPTYIGCTVCSEWLNFTTFNIWFNVHYKEGYHLDKDLLVQGNKLYSPNTCKFIPPKINSLICDNESVRGECFAGVSKRKKKGTQDFNGLYNSSAHGVYLGRFTDEDLAFSHYKEFKGLLYQSYAQYYFELGYIDDETRDALYNREVFR
jgi:hypothetical protein